MSCHADVVTLMDFYVSFCCSEVTCVLWWRALSRVMWLWIFSAVVQLTSKWRRPRRRHHHTRRARRLWSPFTVSEILSVPPPPVVACVTLVAMVTRVTMAGSGGCSIGPWRRTDGRAAALVHTQPEGAWSFVESWLIVQLSQRVKWPTHQTWPASSLLGCCDALCKLPLCRLTVIHCSSMRPLPVICPLKSSRVTSPASALATLYHLYSTVQQRV